MHCVIFDVLAVLYSAVLLEITQHLSILLIERRWQPAGHW